MKAFTLWSRGLTWAALLAVAVGSPVPAGADPEDRELARDRQEIRQDGRTMTLTRRF